MLEVRLRAAEFQHLEMARDVRADIGARIVQRVANASLRGQMDDAGHTLAGKGLGQRARLGDVDAVEGEVFTPQKAGQSPLLQGEVVVVVHVVEANDRLAAIQQGAADMTSDEPGGPGNENRQNISPRTMQAIQSETASIPGGAIIERPNRGQTAQACGKGRLRPESPPLGASVSSHEHIGAQVRSRIRRSLSLPRAWLRPPEDRPKQAD